MIAVQPLLFDGSVLERVWEWLHEFPDANFDDYGPKTFADFCSTVADRIRTEHMWLVKKDDYPCGVVGFLPITDRMGFLHGICFAKDICTSKEKREAVQLVLDQLFAGRVEKVCAGYFADNLKIAQFLSDLGAVREGYLVSHTLRHGQPLDMVQVAIFKV